MEEVLSKSNAQMGPQLESVLPALRFIGWDSNQVQIPEQGTSFLFFISLHCMHCIDFTPDLSELERELPHAAIVLFSTGENEENEEMSAYFKWKFPVIHMSHEEMERLFQVTMLPYGILLVDGKVKQAGVVYNKTNVLQLAARVGL